MNNCIKYSKTKCRDSILASCIIGRITAFLFVCLFLLASFLDLFINHMFDATNITTHVIMFEEAKHFQLPEDSLAAHETLKDVRQFF